MRAQNAPTVPAILPARARRGGCFGGNADAIRPTPSTTGAVCANPSMTACPGATIGNVIGEDLAAFAFDQADRLGEVFRARWGIAAVLGHRRAGIDRDD